MTDRLRFALHTLLVLAGVLVPAIAAADTPACTHPTTLLVVRHADRLGSEDALSAAGIARSLDLARVAANARVAAIYRSDTERTRLTAEPLAVELGIEAVVLPAKDAAGLIEDIFQHHCGETVLVVGHSNTVPLIIVAAGGPTLPDLAENAFDDLFVVTVVEGKATVVNLKYGAPPSSK